MKKHTLYVGLNDKITRMQEINTVDAYKLLQRIVKRDCTITEGRGVYTHDDGKVTVETSLIIEMLDIEGDITDGVINAMAQDIKALLNQESVAYQVTDVTSVLL